MPGAMEKRKPRHVRDHEAIIFSSAGMLSRIVSKLGDATADRLLDVMHSVSFELIVLRPTCGERRIANS